jgi:hypothetical protein
MGKLWHDWLCVVVVRIKEAMIATLSKAIILLMKAVMGYG